LIHFPRGKLITKLFSKPGRKSLQSKNEYIHIFENADLRYSDFFEKQIKADDNERRARRKFVGPKRSPVFVKDEKRISLDYFSNNFQALPKKIFLVFEEFLQGQIWLSKKCLI